MPTIRERAEKAVRETGLSRTYAGFWEDGYERGFTDAMQRMEVTPKAVRAFIQQVDWQKMAMGATADDIRAALKAAERVRSEEGS